ncbi:hypothetical protein [Atlantibacter hermannii]|uniref:hypothetical protein n=1 Tax=Atlantibacter hermannii TaxID=565 RepID=UPI002FF474F6
MHTLIDLGIKQFVYLPLECFSEGFYHELSNCRALPEYREKKTKCTDYILVLSQDCDIDSASFKYIELLVFRKAKERDVKNGTSIEYARSVHKILLKDRENFLLRKDETSLVSKASLLKELEAIKEKGKELPLCDFEIENNRSILLSWLVNYYARRPLPDAFNQDLFGKYIKNHDGHPLQQFLLNYYKEIADIHVFIYPMDNENAEKYDVTITALLHQSCSEYKAQEIKEQLRKIIDGIHADKNRLNMMQSTMISLHADAIMEYVLMPDEFSRKDEINTRRLTLDFLCWMPKDEEI